MSESSGRFTIVNQLGLHARAATKLVQLASKLPVRGRGRATRTGANGKSVMGVLLLCGSKGTVIEVRARGEQPRSASTRSGELIANKFGEGR